VMQDKVLQSWNSSHHSFRVLVFDLLKWLALMAFYNASRVHDAMEIAPPLCFPRHGKRAGEAFSPSLGVPQEGP
jgi:hypothetical protein